MDTDKLRYFVTIAETGSLTKASQILAISHSGLSKAISALEAETKLTLFRPQGRGLEITEEGTWFYSKAQEILRLSDEIARGQIKTSHVLRVGLSEVIAISCAAAIGDDLKVPMKFVEADVGDLETKILNGEIDFGIAFIPSPKPGLEYLELGEVHCNAYAKESLIKSKGLIDLPYALPSMDVSFNPLGYKNRDGWPSEIQRLPYFFVSSFAIALDLLRNGSAAVYMPDFVATKENALSSTPEDKIIKVKKHSGAESQRKIFLVKNKAVEESAEMKKVSKVIRKICLKK